MNDFTELFNILNTMEDNKPQLNHDQIIANQVAGMPLEEAIYQTGYSSGHDAGYEKGRREAQPGGVWVNLATNYTEDWQIMHCRFAIDKYKLDTDLFEEKDGGLVKKGGTGRVAFREVEYLVEAEARSNNPGDIIKGVITKNMVKPKSVDVPEFMESINSMSEEEKREVDEKLATLAAYHNNMPQIAKLSPALKWRSNHKGKAAYPERFGGKVPLKVKVRCNVYPDLPFGNKDGTECKKGEEYYVWVNSLGAVAAILPNGEQLGLKPNEFDVTEYHV